MAKRGAILEILINWKERRVRVTSKIGGHSARFVDLGDRAKLDILEIKKGGNTWKKRRST